MTKDLITAINNTLFASTELQGKVAKRIAYARGTVGSKWPQVHYFEVAETVGYLADYNSITIQFSAWSLNKYESLEIKDILKTLFTRFRGVISITGGEVDINWSELIDSGALPETDPTLYGQYLRYIFKYRGKNLGGL